MNLARIEKRLAALEVPTEAEYEAATERAMVSEWRDCGLPLSETEEVLMEGYGDAEYGRDCALVDRYWDSLPEKQRKKEERKQARKLRSRVYTAVKSLEARG